MTPESFASAIIGNIVDANVRFYREGLERAEGATDPYWIAASSFYARLSPADRDVVIRMMEQAAVDAISNLLGVLDGTSTLEGFEEDFTLRYGSSAEKLNGDLQDFFIGGIEER